MIRAWFGLLMFANVPSAFHFLEKGPEAGLSQRVDCGGPEKNWIMEANGSGMAVLDYDRDGFMDILVVNGGSVEQLAKLLSTGSPDSRSNGVFLYRNLRTGRFEDVTAKSKLLNPHWGTGANAVDFDNDGDTDVLITTIGRDLLYRNEGNGTFAEIGREAGLNQNIAWHTGSAFGDYDADGDLDLYVAGYVQVQSLGVGGKAPVCRYLALPVFCGPMGLKGQADIFYRNNGDGTFTDVTRAAGLNEAKFRFGFAVVFEDFNMDGRPDIFVANDSTPNYLYINTGSGGFEEAGLTNGLAFNSDGRSQANMGVAMGDIDNDGDLDLLTTTFSEDYFPLFEHTADGVYEEISSRVGLTRSTNALLGWACGFVDVDNDGWRDLWVANGHVYPSVGQAKRTTYEQPLVVFRNAMGRFSQAPERIGKGQAQSWRGGASGDFNNDGKVDLAVTPVSGFPAMLENQSVNQNHWVGFDLRGLSLGTRIVVEACGQKFFDTARNGGSYLSANDPRIHFGLGDCKKIGRVQVNWPSGKKQVLTGMPVDRYHTVQQ